MIIPKKVPGYRVLVRIVQKAKQTESGFQMPDSAVDKETYGSMVGVILRIGDTAWTDKTLSKDGKCPYKEGDEVYLLSYGGTILNQASEERIVAINDADIICKTT